MPKINPEPNVFDDNLLDVVGQEFRFDHAKGLAEWLKNSADAYTREDVPDDEQVILIDILERQPKKKSTFKVVDFVGMTHDDIVEAFKRWGDPRAATRGSGKRTLGGHGNGGKFYMRQSFKESRFVTYKNGILNVFGFDRNRRYGFLDGYENRAMPLAEALEYADVDLAALPEPGADRIAESHGFTVVTGDEPENFSGRSTPRSIIDKLANHPQARRLISHKEIFARWGKELDTYTRLSVEEPEPRPDFAEAEARDVPATLIADDGDEYVYKDSSWPDAFLTLSTSRESLRRSGMNRIDFAGEVGIIGTYAIHELGGAMRYPAQAEFVYGECFCPKLEDPAEDCVKNDREKLVDNAKARALLTWVRGHVDELAERIAEADAKERRASDLSQSSAFNELLNRWKNQFMPTLMAELFGGPGEGEGFGGTGTGTGGRGGDDPIVGGDPNDTDTDEGTGKEGGGGDEAKTGPRAPTVLLSGYDADPLNPLEDKPLECSPRHPAVYQRFEDTANGIYWINTSLPFAQRLLSEYSADSPRWRDYMFQRYIEIILKESIRELERKQGDITADSIDSHIDELYLRVYERAETDLLSFLFDQKMVAA